MLKILIPVDFSEGTYKACRYALQLCPPGTGSQLLLVHCFQDYLADADTDIVPPIDQTPSAAIANDIIHRNETEAFEQLESLYNRLLNDLGQNSTIYLERKIVHGSPEDCIPEQVKQFQADLLVMHTDGESGLGRTVFGTVTTKLVEDVKIPVLTVPRNHKNAGINQVLYATDFDAADVTAIRHLQQLLQSATPVITCVHIADDTNQEDQQRLEQMKQALQSTQGNEIRFIVLQGDNVIDSLMEFVQEAGIDLISLVSREHGTWANLFNQNTTRRLVLESQTPLLIFHGQST